MAKINPETSMLIDVQYIRENKRNNTTDYLYIIYKDTETDEKHLSVITEPCMDIYFEKPEFRDHNYNKTYAPLEALEKKTVKAKHIPFAIANEMGSTGRQMIEELQKTRNRDILKQLILYPYVFGADYDVVSWYRIQWLYKMNTSVPKKLKKGFLDIEADGIHVDGMPTPEKCPINAVSLMDDYNSTMYTFILTGQEYKRPSDYDRLSKRQKEKEDKLKYYHETMKIEQDEMINNPEKFIDELHETFDDTYNVKDYKLFFYTDEKKMLVHLFQLINSLKLDFIAIWNMGFDIPYIMRRMKTLGLDPTEIMCHPDFPVKECYFKEDTFNFDIKNKADSFTLSSYTIFRDQMQIYASIRKGGSELRGYKLNYISDIELGDKKVQFEDDVDFKLLPYLYFRKFIIYNIKDVLLQKGIENKTGDLDTHYMTSFMNATPYSKVHMPTVRIRNRQLLSYYKQNIIPGSNINVFNAYVEKVQSDDDDETDDSFEGALVADPIYNDYVGMELYGEKTNNIHADAIDLDMGAFYPNCIFGMNIEPSTLIFKMIMASNQFIRGEMKLNGITKNNIDLNEDIAKECMDNFQTLDYLSFASKWLGLSQIDSIMKKYNRKRIKNYANIR